MVRERKRKQHCQLLEELKYLKKTNLSFSLSIHIQSVGIYAEITAVTHTYSSFLNVQLFSMHSLE